MENVDTVPALIPRQVRDHNRGEAWYFNPLTGKSQWDRPEALLGTITPSEKVREELVTGNHRNVTHSPSRPDELSAEKHVFNACLHRRPYDSGAACYRICPGTRTDNAEQRFGVRVPTDTHSATVQ